MVASLSWLVIYLRRLAGRSVRSGEVAAQLRCDVDMNATGTHDRRWTSPGRRRRVRALAGRSARSGCPGRCLHRTSRSLAPRHPPGSGVLAGKEWRRDLTLRPRAYESLLARPPPFASIRFPASGRRKSRIASGRPKWRPEAIIGSVDARRGGVALWRDTLT